MDSTIRMLGLWMKGFCDSCHILVRASASMPIACCAAAFLFAPCYGAQMLRFTILAIALFLTLPCAAANAESATAEEVIEKTREAADYLAKKGLAGIETFRTMHSPFAWKDDGYVFVNDCDAGLMLVNPGTGRANRPLQNMRDYSGQFIGKLICQNGKRAGGGWFIAMVSKPGSKKPIRKLIFCRPVFETSYQVCSGIYSDTANIADLEKLSRFSR